MNQRRLDPSVKEGLERAVSNLHTEFGAVFSREAIAQVVADSHDSLGAYRVATYVPLLAHRFAREHLREAATTGGDIDGEQPKD